MKSKVLKEFEVLKKEYKQEQLVQPVEKGLKDLPKFFNKVKFALDKVETFVKESETDKLVFKVEYGNLKLPKSTIISSCGTWFNCSGKKYGFCEICQFCYDKSPEIRYKEVLASRIKKELLFRAFDSETLAGQIIPQVKKSTKLNRFNEVGEIRHQKDFIKLVEISEALFNETGILSYVYTHNKGLDLTIQHPYLIVNTSNFAQKGANNTYKVLETNKQVKKDWKQCICDCKNCNMCAKTGNTIYEILRK